MTLTASEHSPHVAAEQIALACGADNNYAQPLAVMLYSALVNLRKDLDVYIYVVDGGMKPDTKERLRRVVETGYPGAHLEYAQPDIRTLGDLPTGAHFTVATYLRLLLPEIVPLRFNKVIYLDCDMHVEADLYEVWSQDMAGKAALAVQDYANPTVACGKSLRGYASLGLAPDTPYFNSGLLCLNLQRWRTEAIAQKVLRFTREHPEEVKFADQDGLNVILAHDWGMLDLRWNVITPIFWCETWEPSTLKETVCPQKDRLIRDAAIFHFIGDIKPWQPWSHHVAQAAWLGHLGECGWFTPAEKLRWKLGWQFNYYWWQLTWRFRTGSKH